jgi:excisionase family DNA binding protein
MNAEFLTAEEVAEYLRLPLSTVYKLVQDKRLPGFKVGKHWRFRTRRKSGYPLERMSISVIGSLFIGKKHW